MPAAGGIAMLRSGSLVLGTLILALRLAPEGIAIAWDAPASCPDVEYVRGRISEHLRGVEVEAAEVRAQVLAPALEGAPWRLQLVMGDGGRRELEGESCTALADAAAVMIAISLNAAARAAELAIPEPPPEPPGPAPGPDGEPIQPREDDAGAAAVPTLTGDPLAPSRDPDALDPSITTETSRRTRQARRPLQALVGVTTGGHGVGLPAPGAGLGGRVGLRWGPLSLALVGTHWFRRQRPVVGDVAARYRLTTAGLEPCGGLTRGRAPWVFEPLACGVIEAGVLWARGVGALPSLTQRHPWIALGGGVGVAWVPRSWLAVGLRADVVAPLLGRQFVIGTASAGAVGPVDARGAVAVELRLPRIVRSR